MTETVDVRIRVKKKEKICVIGHVRDQVHNITCDNVSNNTLMITCFAAMVQQATDEEFNAVKQQI